MNRRAILKRVLLVLACWCPVTLFYWEAFAYWSCRKVAWDTARSMGMSYGDDGYQEFVDYLCPPVGEFLEFPMGFVTIRGWNGEQGHPKNGELCKPFGDSPQRKRVHLRLLRAVHEGCRVSAHRGRHPAMEA